MTTVKTEYPVRQAHYKLIIKMSTVDAVDSVNVKLYGNHKPHHVTSTTLRLNYVDIVKAIVREDKLGIGRHCYCLCFKSDNTGLYTVTACKTKETVRFIPSELIPSIQHKCTRLISCTQ